MRLFSSRNRPPHLGPYPMERLPRAVGPARLDGIAPFEPLAFHRPGAPRSIVNAMAEAQAMLDTIRDGPVNGAPSDLPADPAERSRHLKSFGYFHDASLVGIGPMDGLQLQQPARNPDIDRLSDTLRTRQTKTLAAGIDLIMADLRDAAGAPLGSIDGHGSVIVFAYAHPRDPEAGEEGCEWIEDAQAHRACLRASETATVIASYIRLMGHEARAHSGSTTEIDLNRAAVAAGLGVARDGAVTNPYLGTAFGVAAVTTSMPLSHDAPLAPEALDAGSDLRWRLGVDTGVRAADHRPFASRRFVDGEHPFETLKRVDDPTTYIDEARVPRVPKRADMFARAQFGDMGSKVQKQATNGLYARKAATAAAQRRALGAFTLLQTGEGSDDPVRLEPQEAARLVKATSYFLGLDAVGISRCPDWTWYSHDAGGDAIDPPHDQAISMIVDQGFETMEGASGDDWISVAQSMRAYLRFSVLGCVLVRQIERLGYSAKAHTVIDSTVLHPPLLLLSGLGEVSRIGEVILNPFLGPRLKSGVVTTDLPMAHDRPIDFGLQRFCEACNKCARECPSGAITAGPKLMFNGYEIWKSDSQKCATYRITTEGGAMCGRCMKTCPWNLEGLFAEKPFRWAAMNLPAAAPALAKLDDMAGRGGLNPVKKWWWDLELKEDGGYRVPGAPVNARGIQPDLDVRYEDQTLAVYPAPLAAHRWPFPDPMNRERGIEAYRAMVPAQEHRRRVADGTLDTTWLKPRAETDAPVLPLVVTKAEAMTADIVKYELARPDGGDLPPWTAGAHLDVVVAPEFLRQYSMSGDPADRSVYQIGVLREDTGRGGSLLMHRIFQPGRRVFVSPPINHFELVEDAPETLLMAGGIGVTPMIAMAHRLHALGRAFALHYSVPSREAAAYRKDLGAAPWADRVVWHVSNENGRIDLPSTIAGADAGAHVYTCGPERYMEAVLETCARAGWPEERIHREFFAVPEVGERPLHAFQFVLNDGREIAVQEGQIPTDALLAAGVAVDVKCSDGLCGVCRCAVLEGDVDHRDFVLSAAQREGAMILCQSRAAEPGGTVRIDL